MSVQTPSEQASPWRRLFEEVRRAAGNLRDDDGVQGSINWIRKQMERRGANPNVVRNIIYRDKGRLADKRVLFEILADLWQQRTQDSLKAPEIEVLLAHGDGAESEILQLLGREKRRVYRTFVSGVRSGACPRLVVTGRPGSGKTMLIDYVQESLELSAGEGERLVRLEFASGHLSSSLARLATAVGVPSQVIEMKLAKIGASDAFAVQADAQAELARVVLEAVRSREEPLVLLAHMSRPASGGEDLLGGAPLRLNTPEVSRVTTPEWLWLSLFEPLSRLPHVSLLVSVSELPNRALAAMGGFIEPIRLSPPTASDSRKFVRARLPQLDERQQEALVRRAGRSYEDLRTFTLLCEIREPLAGSGAGSHQASENHLGRLSALVGNAGDERLRDFLAVLATLSLPEFPTFSLEALGAVRATVAAPSSLELAFLDPVPPDPDRWRAFSRRFARLLRKNLEEQQPERYRRLNLAAARFYSQAAEGDPGGECAGRHVHHLLNARDWTSLTGWIERFGIQQALIGPLWTAALAELRSGPEFERVARHVAAHFVRLGSYDHPDAIQAFTALSDSAKPSLRTWALIQRAEGAVLRGQIDQAEELLEQCPVAGDQLRMAEAALVRANIARWRSALDEAAVLVESVARPNLTAAEGRGREGRMALAKAGVWAGLIAKDRGDLTAALREFSAIDSGDELVEARVAFQRGDVLLAMGRFDAALQALDCAVRLSRRNQALIQEQSRYLCRRGRLRRKRGELELSHADFDAARAVVLSSRDATNDLERDFWLALCDEEQALTLLAGGEYERAILKLEDCMASFERYARHYSVDASYRVLRSTLRLALAYASRGLGQPYRMPFRHTAKDDPAGLDLRHARSLHASVLETLSTRGGVRLHWSLRRHAQLLGSLMAGEPAQAAAEARCAVAEARLPYHAAEGLAYLTSAALRAGDSITALDCIERARAALQPLSDSGERGDVALQAWLRGMAIQARLLATNYQEAATTLAELLTDPALTAFHDTALRMFGEAVEAGGHCPALRVPALVRAMGWREELARGRMRLPDQLSASWKISRNRTSETV